MEIMKVIVRLFAALLLIVGLAGRTGAQTLTSTVEGTVTDESGAVLPGVTVTLTGPRGPQTAVSDAKGQFRFVAVDPDNYKLKVELQGFGAQERDVKVDINKTSTTDFSLKVGGLSEAVNVSAEASTVDVKSAATNNTVSNAMLQMTPLYSSTSTGLLNAAPGINSSSAFGGTASYGNALLLDGVDTRDPEGGSAWTFFNQNLIDEIQIGGLGAPAEYGGFTGAIINTIMKSGSNTYSGLFSMRYTDKGLSSNNVAPEVIAQNASLGQASVLKKLKDYTVQMGGPIKHDKAFFFASVQRYSDLFDPSGPVANNPDISPRFNVKLTLQPRTSDSFVIGTQYDSYNVKGRVGRWPSSQATDDATVTEDAPEWVWNAQWRHIFNTNTLLEAKFTGYSGYYYLDPVNPAPVVIDVATNTFSGGGGGVYYADRTRNQAQVALTKYAQLAGSHSFKFGAEIERSHVRSQYQPYGPQGFYIYQYAGVPYYQVSYGYDVQGDNHRTSAYAQDQWSMGRATLNIGLRMDKITGYSPELKQTVYTPHTSWGPRVGLAYNLTKAGTSALKGFWGRYYEGAAASFFTQATPGIGDFTFTPIDPVTGAVDGPPDVVTPGQVFGISKDISHPRTDEFNVSYEQQLMRGIGRLTVTGVWRNGGNFLNNVITDARWSPVTVPNVLTGGTMTAYAWANQEASNESFQIRNTSGFQYLDPNGNVITTADPTRKYKALMLVLTNQLKGRFGYQGSYVLSKSTGSVDNSGEGNYEGNSSWNSPNTMFINSVGELTNSRRHEIKAFLTYRVPVIDLMVAANYTGVSGRPYTPFEVLTSSQLDVPGSSRRTIFLEPRGSRVTPFTNQTDLRLEKAFHVQGYRFGVYADWVNLFNAAGVTGIQGRVPSSGGVAFGAPTSLQGARQITFGGRWSF
jgi:hypothetical protein